MAGLLKTVSHLRSTGINSETALRKPMPSIKFRVFRILRSDKIPGIVAVTIGLVALVQIGVIYFTSFPS